MGNQQASSLASPSSPSTASVPHETDNKPVSAADDKKKLKPCCACPETKQPRDAWYDLNGEDVKPLSDLFSLVYSIVERGEENCKELIEAHKACMRALGFNI